MKSSRSPNVADRTFALTGKTDPQGNWKMKSKSAEKLDDLTHYPVRPKSAGSSALSTGDSRNTVKTWSVSDRTSLQKWESDDTFIVRGSEGEMSPPLPRRPGMDRSRSEPDLDSMSLVSSEDFRPLTFNEIRAKYESGYLSETHEEAHQSTVCEDLRKIRERYEAHSNKDWRHDDRSCTRAPELPPPPQIPPKSTHTQPPNTNYKYSHVERPAATCDKSRKVPSPQSYTRASREFALNIDMIDREWKSERERKLQRERSPEHATLTRSTYTYHNDQEYQTPDKHSRGPADFTQGMQHADMQHAIPG